MPMPPGTYRNVKADDRIKANAAVAKKTVALAKAGEKKANEQSQFFEALNKISQTRLAKQKKDMDALVEDIKKNGALSKEDKVRKAVSEVLLDVKKILQKAKDLQSLDATLKRPSEAVMRAPTGLGVAGAELALAIALVQVLSVFVRLRRDKSQR